MVKKIVLSKKEEIKNVQPIRSLEQIRDMKWALKRFCGQRDYICFLLGINCGLRISDMLKLKVKDVKGKKRVIVREGKTKKPRIILLTNIYGELNDYINTIEGSEWLFPSRKGNRPISRIQAYRQLRKGADMADLESVGTHTCRKTFGFWHYKQFKDIAELQMILNHAHPEITLRYIGITDEQIENHLHDFIL